MIHRLSINMNYAVHWTADQMMRDFIQNFYDAAGEKNFHHQFQYHYSDGSLEMSSEGGFSKEWLLYFGASTKRNSHKTFAGKYGEGFKIAALVAIRDYGLGVTMESRDWRIEVISSDKSVKETSMSFLTYDITSRPENEGRSVLTLKNVSDDLFRVFKNNVFTFLYPENPILGDVIYEEDDIRVYHTKEGISKGCVFTSFQKRGDIPLPYVFCWNEYTSDRDDRDRKNFYSSELKWIICHCVSFIPYKDLGDMLEVMKPYWKGKTPRRDPYGYGVLLVKIILEKLSKSDSFINSFKSKYGAVLAADNSMDMNQNRRMIMKNWYRLYKDELTLELVMDNFSYVGIQTLEEICEQNNGFDVIRDPTATEYKRILLLQNIANDYFRDILCYDSLPPCKVIINDNAPIAGESIGRRSELRTVNAFGLRVLTDVQIVKMKGRLLRHDHFAEALSTYLHELLHQFGGDRHPQFHYALILMCRRLLDLREILEKEKGKWEKS